MSIPVTPASAAYGTTATRTQDHMSRPLSYIGSDQHSINAVDTVHGAPQEGSVLSHSVGMHDENLATDGSSGLQRSNSQVSQTQTHLPSRGGTLKKKASVHKSASVRRSDSKKSSYAGSVRSMKLGEKEKYEPSEETNSAFYCPVPTSGSPTELLADRFQAWRKVLKDLINYFRDLHKSYESRSKSLHSASNIINNTTIPSNFLASGGLGDAAHILRDFHKHSLTEANKARDLENEVIMQLTGLRSDLQQKIKEIKSLSGDFKNNVGKEQDGTRKAVRQLHEALGVVDQDAAATAGKGDPFLVKLGVDRQLEKQIEEENYLHRAYLNLEASGRELESIVIGEIQKAYNVLAGILKREADHSYETAEKLREGPLGMPKDHEWDSFVVTSDHMVDPRQPLRQVKQITYSGKDHPAAVEIRSGMLERKSKYLKNYTPGWYILSPTHLHEFKSADRIAFQQPIMSLYLPEQKLSSHSEAGSSSHKFMLKGRQTGSMHRGHTWIFRAETYDTMIAWYGDIKELTEKRGEARNEFVRRTHARSLSGNSMKAPSVASGDSAMEEDEADQVAFSSEQSVRGLNLEDGAALGLGAAAGAGAYALDDGRSEVGWRPQRPAPGGRFPSDVNVQRGLQAPLSPSSEGNNSIDENRDVIAAASALPGSGLSSVGGMQQSHIDPQSQPQMKSTLQDTRNEPVEAIQGGSASPSYTTNQHPNTLPTSTSAPATAPAETQSNYGDWMAPMAAGAGGAALGAGAMHHHKNKEEELAESRQSIRDGTDSDAAIPQPGHSSAPMMVASAAPLDAPTRPRAMTGSTEATTTTAGYSNTASTAPTSTSIYGSEVPAAGVASLGSMRPEPVSTSETDKSMFDENGVYVGLRTATTDPTIYSVRPTYHHAKSVQTISDLHVPGEYPKTPAESTTAPRFSSETTLR